MNGPNARAQPANLPDSALSLRTVGRRGTFSTFVLPPPLLRNCLDRLIQSLPVREEGIATSSDGTKIYVFSGDYWDGAAESPYPGNQILDVATNVWDTTITGMPSPTGRSGLPCAGLISGKIYVTGTADNGPAHLADIREGDLISSVADQAVGSVADFYRTVWALGPAGTDVPLGIVRSGTRLKATVHSMDRADHFKRPQAH